MFINFFHDLKKAGVTVTVREYLTLMEALDADIIERSPTDFYYLSRSALVKDERNIDKFDKVFGATFKGLESLAEGLEVDIPEGRHDGKRDLDANLRISVPAGASLAIESVSTSTAVGGVGGSVAVESVSGGVEIDGAPESASAETVSGAIKITGSRGRVHAESVSGSVLRAPLDEPGLPIHRARAAA